MALMNFRAIAARRNRGMLLDVVMFLTSLILLTVLARRLTALVEDAKEDVYARIAVGLFCLALVFLQPLAVLLKRRQAAKLYADEKDEYNRFVQGFGFYYFLSQLFLIGTAVSLFFGISDQHYAFDGVCLGQFALAVTLGFVNTRIVGLYLTPPKHGPLFKVLALPIADLLGDLLLLLNVILSQAFWGFLMTSAARHSSFGLEFIWMSLLVPEPNYNVVARLGCLILATLIFYLSPRYVYLVADKHRKIVWVTILLANTPMIYRVIFGS